MPRPPFVSCLALGLAVASVAAACSDEEHAAPVTASPFSACRPPARPAGNGVSFVPAFGGRSFTAPVELVFGPEGRAYVVEQGGRVKVVPASGGETTEAIDLSDRIASGGEAGLLGLAFDPSFATNGFVYMYFTRKGRTGTDFALEDVLARFTSTDGGATFDPASEKVLLAVDDPFSNHNGGHVAFGPDGWLYVGLGDGGSGGDPLGNGQNVEVLLGKLLRIDPHGGEPYGIPPENPFANGGGRPEIYARGLRNPWKFSFDAVSGDLWLGDVGQGAHEEVDLVVSGGNYGWSVREGKHCFAARECASAGLVDPVAEYGRDEGASITAGYVYRGTRIPELVGKLIYGDFVSGNVWSVDAKQTSGTLLASSSFKISSFGQSPDGEVYLVDYASGEIQQLAVGAPASEDPAAVGLAATGCLDPARPSAAPASAIAYDVNSPLWSDGAAKERWLFVPEGKRIGVAADGDFDLPPGSVAVKTFSVSGKKVETRLFVRYDDGGWAGFSYEWNDDQSDAVLVPGGRTKQLADGSSWYFPSRSECFACHTASAGFSLGLEARQLDKPPASGKESNLLDRFAAVLDAPIASGSFSALRAADAPAATSEERARGYLHGNCSMCHREGSGAGAATLDLRITQPFAGTKTCDVLPQAGDIGVPGARIVTPGEPARSTLALRMRSLGGERMPPLASRAVDEVGVAAVETWIRELTACP